MDRIRRHESRLAWLLPALALTVLVIGAARLWPRTVDDAYITFRYAQNLVAGEGPVFNPGERVEGYSSPSWMMLSATALGAGIDPVLLAKICGLLASVGLLVCLARDLQRSGIPAVERGLAALVLGSSLVLAVWSVAAMETNAYALLLFCGLTALASTPLSMPRSLGASCWLAAAALTRPEGLGFWVAGAIVTVVPAGNARARRLAAYLVPGLALLVHLAWRWAYYGAPLPNTYYAKTGGGWAMWRQGLDGLLQFAARPAHAPWLVLAALGVWVGLRGPEPLRRRAALFAGAVVLQVLYIVSVGDDGLRVHRFYVPILAPLAALVALLLAALARSGPRRHAAIAAVALCVAASQWDLHARLAPSLLHGALDYQRGNIKLGRYLRQDPAGGPDPLVAVAAAGAIPYYSEAPTIDMYGLNDAHIAREPFPDIPGGRLMKWDNAYVLSRGPDVIAINRGYFPPGDALAERVPSDPGLLVASPMDRDLFRRVAVDGRYGLEAIRFDDGSLFYVFRRRPENR